MIWKFFKTLLSLLLSIIVASSVLDFLRKPVLPNDVLNTALYDLDNQPFFLPQLAQDRPTIRYVWGSWCGYCRYVSPAIDSLARQGTPVISIALRSGNTDEVKKYLTTNGYQFTTLNDPQGELAAKWQVNVTPTVIILRQNKIALSTTGLTSIWGLKVRLFLAEFFNL